MKISIDLAKKRILYVLIIISLFFNWLLSYFDNSIKNITWIAISSVIIIIYLNELEKKNKVNLHSVIVNTLLFFCVIMNVVIHGINNTAFVNLFFSLFSLIIIKFIIDFYYDNSSIFAFFLKPKFIRLFNIYFLINTLIILMQSKNKGFLMSIDYNSKFLYDDFVTGFMGPGGTHSLTLLYILLTFININYANVSNSNKKIRLYIYIIASIFIMLYTSGLNDNTAFLVIFPIAIVAKIIYDNKINFKLLVRIFILSMGVMILFYFIYRRNVDFQHLVDVRLGSKVQGYFFSNDSTESWGDERMVVLSYVLENSNGWFTGMGFKSDISEAVLKTNLNVGMSDISRLTYHAGIFFYGLYCYVISNLILKIYAKKNNKIKMLNRIIILVICMVFTIYSSISRSPYSAVLLPLCFIFVQKDIKNLTIR